MTIGLIVSAYTTASVATAFVGASAMFGAAAVYGAVTKRELSGIGGYLFIALIGILVASLINIFLASSGLTWVISIIGVILFTVLTAYDVQRIKAGNLAAATRLDGEGGRHGRPRPSISTSSTCSCSCSASLGGRN